MAFNTRRWSRKNKYGSTPTTVGSIKFHSKKEAARYVVLKQLEDRGNIADLKLQPRFSLDINGIHICDYIADFQYCENGKRVVEDVKGWRTHVYLLKKKLMLAVHGIKIYET